MLTPDGRTLVFSMNGRLYRRSLDSFDTSAIPGTDGAHAPVVSPDGRAVAFFRHGELRRVSLDGGNQVTLAEVNDNMPGACWCTDDEILFSRTWTTGLWAVPAGGGPPRQVTEPDRSKGERGHWRPHPLPGGKRVLFTIVMAGAGVNDSRVAALDVATGQYTALFPGSDGQYLRSGHILYFFGGVWQRVPFDDAAVRTTGDPVTVLPDAFGLRPDGGESGNLLSVSDNGVLAYLPGPTIPRLELAWVDQAGAIEPLGLPPHAIYSASLSPDGRRIAMTRLEGGSFEVWVADVARKTEDRMDLRGGNQAPHWDPNGDFLVFISERKGQYDTYIARPDGSGERALLEADHDEAPVAWSHDGRRIIAREWRTDGTEPLVSVDAAGGGTPEVVMPSTSQQLNVELSPDDRWLAYVSDTSGRREVYVRGLARDATALRVSSDGGDHPYWSPSGRELFFVRGDTLMAAAFRGDGSVPQVGPPRALVTLAPSAELFGVGSDGRFLVGRPVEPPAAPGVRVVLNWFSGVGAPTGRE